MKMKKLLIIALISLFFVGCNDSASVSYTKKSGANKPKPEKPEKKESQIAHSNEKQNIPLATSKQSKAKKKWTRSGNPIDTSKFDAAIAQADKDLKTAPKKESLKNALSEAYYKRGFVLTEARQYASAIGDFRRSLKYNPANSESKKWIAVIINIYKSINREAPKEGEEPAALEFKKDKA